MKLHFIKEEIDKIIKAVEAGSDHRVVYTGGDWEGSPPLDTTPGITIVGDEGVYVIGNHEHRDADGKKASPRKLGLVAYAIECNPHGDSDDWYDVKVSTFGGDDGASGFSLEDVKASWSGDNPWVEFTPTSVRIGSTLR